ncbi:MAG: lysophospholipid acyltransferase family protein [Alphaproteobacteria bacterium]
MRRLIKRIGRSEALRRALCWLAAQYIRFVYVTTRWRIEGRAPVDALLAAGQPIIPAFWHSRLLMAPFGWDRCLPTKVLVSTHRDGELIARTVRHLGIDSIRGSTTRGGVAALRAMLKALKSGAHVVVTPDGPRGPRMRVQPGAILAASLSGAPIVPATCAVSHCRFLATWDRFVLALPFGRGIYLWGEPLSVPRDADEAAREAARRELERRLNALTERADRLMGHTPIEPAPEPAAAPEPKAAT